MSLLKDCENFHSVHAQGGLYSRPAAKYSKANLRVWEQLHGNLSTDFSDCIRLLCRAGFLFVKNKELFVVRSTSSVHWFIDYQQAVSDFSIDNLFVYNSDVMISLMSDCFEITISIKWENGIKLLNVWVNEDH